MHLQTLKNNFGTQKQCLDYLASLRWPNKLSCSNARCQEYMTQRNKTYTLSSQYKFRCGFCRHQHSVITDTLFQDTQYKLIPLWFRAIWYIASQKGGTSALGLQKCLGLGTYRTAWTWLQKLRYIMITKDEKLKGTILIERFNIKIKSKDKRYPDYLETKHEILIAVELRDDKIIGNIRMKAGYYLNSVDIFYFIKNNIKASNNTILKDGSSDLTRLSDTILIGDKTMDFSKLPKHDYCVKLVTKQTENSEPVCKVISFLENNNMFNSLQCKCSSTYLDLYLNECCYKFNNRNNEDSWFYDLLQKAVNSKPIQKTQ